MKNNITDPLLNVINLTVTLCNKTTNHQHQLLHNLSFTLNRNQCLAVIGESGSGKTIMSKAIIGLCPQEFNLSGEVIFQHQNLLTLPKNDACWSQIRGRRIAMIPQNSLNAFNPLLSIGTQIEETLKQHLILSKSQLLAQINHVLEKVALPDYSHLAKKYPHEISGGMLQRITIALAFILKPDIIIADEPTSSIDWLTKKEVLVFFKQLLNDHQTALLLITHDFAEANELSDHLIVLKQGKIVETGATKQILSHPQHTYTQNLLNARNKLDTFFLKHRQSDKAQREPAC